MTVILTDPTPTVPIPLQRTTEPTGLPVHPVWCDPARCESDAPYDGEALVVHRRVLLDEPFALGRGRMVVDVVRGDVVCIHGGELLAHDPGAVRVRGVGDEDELTPDQARRLAAALAQAAYIAGGAR